MTSPSRARPSESGPLPATLFPLADQWYTLCERAPYADKIMISGELAEAIVRTIAEATSPEARAVGPGIFDAAEYEFEIWRDLDMCAGGAGRREMVLTESQRYADYNATAEIRYFIRYPISVEALTGPQKAPGAQAGDCLTGPLDPEGLIRHFQGDARLMPQTIVALARELLTTKATP